MAKKNSKNIIFSKEYPHYENYVTREKIKPRNKIAPKKAIERAKNERQENS